VKANTRLWIVQALLAALFLFSGSMKLILPLSAMTMPVHLPGLFLRFIGVAEILGAIGLILPGLLKIRPELTPIAAAGLVIIMAGATVVTVLGGGTLLALLPLIVGVLAATVAYARWRQPIIESRVPADFGDLRSAERAQPWRVQHGSRGSAVR
jgi:hypothetical protein